MIAQKASEAGADRLDRLERGVLARDNKLAY